MSVRFRFGMKTRGDLVASFAAVSAHSFPLIPMRLGTLSYMIFGASFMIKSRIDVV